MAKVAILVDGGYYQKEALKSWGEQKPKQRVTELENYCRSFIKEGQDLYGIFYYDCQPPKWIPPFPKLFASDVPNKGVPSINYWKIDFLKHLENSPCIKVKRGELSTSNRWEFKPQFTEKILGGIQPMPEITPNDIQPVIRQKGVDVQIAIDIVYFILKENVNQIILISGDNDFKPVCAFAKDYGAEVVIERIIPRDNSDQQNNTQIADEESIKTTNIDDTTTTDEKSIKTTDTDIDNATIVDEESIETTGIEIP